MQADEFEETVNVPTVDSARLLQMTGTMWDDFRPGHEGQYLHFLGASGVSVATGWSVKLKFRETRDVPGASMFRYVRNPLKDMTRL